MKNQHGFILIELIAVLVLTGIIATFAALFFTTGFTGYQDSKTTSEGALNAQMALDRITLELRYITNFTSNPTSISYSNVKLTGTRTINYNGSDILINGNMLLEDVSTFNLSTICIDLDNVGADETAHIDIEFNVSGIGKKFKTKIFPRNMVNCPP